MLCELSCDDTPCRPYTELPVHLYASCVCLCRLVGLRHQEIEVYRSNPAMGLGWRIRMQTPVSCRPKIILQNDSDVNLPWPYAHFIRWTYRTARRKLGISCMHDVTASTGWPSVDGLTDIQNAAMPNIAQVPLSPSTASSRPLPRPALTRQRPLSPCLAPLSCCVPLVCCC